MKKIIFASIAVMALVSCKKDYTCECTETYTSNGTTETSVSSVVIKDVSKKTINNASECVSYEETSTNSNGSIYITKVDCTIEKN